MSQTRTLSAVEASINVIIGWQIALVTQIAMFPLLNLQAALSQHVTLSLVFTVISLLRSYVLRRLFARLG